jgi:hypothetical protein
MLDPVFRRSLRVADPAHSLRIHFEYIGKVIGAPFTPGAFRDVNI